MGGVNFVNGCDYRSCSGRLDFGGSGYLDNCYIAVSTLVVILIMVLTTVIRLTVSTVLLIAWHYALVILALLLHSGHKHLNYRGDLLNVFVFVLRG